MEKEALQSTQKTNAMTRGHALQVCCVEKKTSHGSQTNRRKVVTTWHALLVSLPHHHVNDGYLHKHEAHVNNPHSTGPMSATL
jgi:hypothetical protein